LACVLGQSIGRLDSDPTFRPFPDIDRQQAALALKSGMPDGLFSNQNVKFG
jgi:hypothetical protein